MHTVKAVCKYSRRSAVLRGSMQFKHSCTSSESVCVCVCVCVWSCGRVEPVASPPVLIRLGFPAALWHTPAVVKGSPFYLFYCAPLFLDVLAFKRFYSAQPTLFCAPISHLAVNKAIIYFATNQAFCRKVLFISDEKVNKVDGSF